MQVGLCPGVSITFAFIPSNKVMESSSRTTLIFFPEYIIGLSWYLDRFSFAEAKASTPASLV